MFSDQVAYNFSDAGAVFRGQSGIQRSLSLKRITVLPTGPVFQDDCQGDNIHLSLIRHNTRIQPLGLAAPSPKCLSSEFPRSPMQSANLNSQTPTEIPTRINACRQHPEPLARRPQPPRERLPTLSGLSVLALKTYGEVVYSSQQVQENTALRCIHVHSQIQKQALRSTGPGTCCS
jgi:hypothetical protein